MLNLLIVEDDLNMIDLLKAQNESKFDKIHFARSIDRAMYILNNCAINICLIDINLKNANCDSKPSINRDGMAILKNIVSSKKLNNVIPITMTCEESKEFSIESLKMGAFDHCVKYYRSNGKFDYCHAIDKAIKHISDLKRYDEMNSMLNTISNCIIGLTEEIQIAKDSMNDNLNRKNDNHLKVLTLRFQNEMSKFGSKTSNKMERSTATPVLA